MGRLGLLLLALLALLSGPCAAAPGAAEAQLPKPRSPVRRQAAARSPLGAGAPLPSAANCTWIDYTQAGRGQQAGGSQDRAPGLHHPSIHPSMPSPPTP